MTAHVQLLVCIDVVVVEGTHNRFSIRFFSLINFSFFLSCNFLSTACFLELGPSSSFESAVLGACKFHKKKVIINFSTI